MASKSNPTVKMAADILLNIPENAEIKKLVEKYEKIELEIHSSINKAQKEGINKGQKRIVRHLLQKDKNISEIADIIWLTNDEIEFLINDNN
jgi:hypothetical protein